ncbi:MAG: pilus assembly protein, partial [Hyphomicrobiales bacterium]|nr:pilus assembly protein [Hyphomicrobiales bacterium]
MWKYLSDLLCAFRHDNKGAAALLFGITLIPVLLAIGSSVDYARALSAKQRLAQAIDAAGLAAASWPDLTATQIEAKVQEFIDANFPSQIEGSPTTITAVKTEHNLTITADGVVDTTFMRIAGINHVPISAFTEISLKQKKIELVMALDNTGSMSWSGKLATLKDAAETLVDTLKPDGNPDDEEVKIGLVPFAAAVNIGSDKLGTGWIDETAQSSIAGEDFAPGVNVLDLYNQITNRSWNGCVRARPAPFDTQDNAPTSADTRWVPYFAPDEPDVGSYPNRYASDSGYSGGYWDYDARQRYIGKYSGLTLTSWEDDGPDDNCEIPTVTPLTQNKSDVISGINAMISSGYTVIPAGLSWGWRLISPTEPFTEGADYDDDDVIKAIILLTDGQNDVNGGNGSHNGSR